MKSASYRGADNQATDHFCGRSRRHCSAPCSRVYASVPYPTSRCTALHRTVTHSIASHRSISALSHSSFAVPVSSHKKSFPFPPLTRSTPASHPTKILLCFLHRMHFSLQRSPVAQSERIIPETSILAVRKACAWLTQEEGSVGNSCECNCNLNKSSSGAASVQASATIPYWEKQERGSHSFSLRLPEPSK